MKRARKHPGRDELVLAAAPILQALQDVYKSWIGDEHKGFQNKLIVLDREVERAVEMRLDPEKFKISFLLEASLSNLLQTVVPSANWSRFFTRIGSTTLALLVEDCKEPFSDTTFLLFLGNKSVRYGFEPLVRWGPLGILIRITSKVGRLSTMTAHPTLDPFDNESIYDTVRDILGYCILGILLQKGYMYEH
jgi:hypothetical protein